MNIGSAIKSGASVTVSKDTEMGLFRRWDGAGSVLEIRPERDVVIPAELVFSFMPDVKRKEDYGYGVQDVYGLVHEAWAKGSIRTA